MDIFGAITGAASLYPLCLQIIGQVESYKTSAIDSEALSASFRAKKELFHDWVESVGLTPVGLAENHHEKLDSPKTAAVVQALLSSILKLFNTRNTLDVSDFDRLSLKPADKQPKTSRMDRLSWAVGGKEKFDEKVSRFGDLVQSLRDLVPPKSDTGLESSYRMNFRILQSQELARWLQASHTNTLYETFRDRILEGTCHWVFDRPEYIVWTSPHDAGDQPVAKLLWINGPAGYGKSVLSARIAQHWMDVASPSNTPESLGRTSDVPETSAPLVAYYFFSFESGNRSDPFDIVRSWIAQIVAVDEAAFLMAFLRCIKQTVPGRVASRNDVIDVFHSIVSTVSNCILILDGLDECTQTTTETRNFAKETSRTAFIDEVRGAISGTRTRLLVVSRDEVDIRSSIMAPSSDHQLVDVQELKILPGDVHEDVSLFSKSVVDKMKQSRRKPEADREELARRMAQKSEGMFQWVKIIGGQLHGNKSKNALDKLVDGTSIGLERVYDRSWAMVCQRSGEEVSRAFAAFRWVVFGLRPLTVREMTTALVIQVDDYGVESLSEDDFPAEIDEEFVNSEILEVCGSLLEVRKPTSDDDSKDGTDDIGSWTLHPVHFSVKEYIIEHLPPPDVLVTNKHLVTSGKLHTEMLARLCLRYLNFESTWVEQDGIPAALTTAFRDYTAGTWQRHLDFPPTANLENGVLTPNITNKETLELINTFFKPGNGNWQSWIEWYGSNKNGAAPGRPRFAPPSEAGPAWSLAYQACHFGLTETAIHLIETYNLDVNSQDEAGRCFLVVAAHESRVPIVRFLLTKGAAVDLQVRDRSTPLQLAMHRGNKDVVNLLLEHGAATTINQADKQGWTPLAVALSKGRTEVAMTLMRRAIKDRLRIDHGYPLHHAVIQGAYEIARMLIENDSASLVSKEDASEGTADSSIHVPMVMQKNIDGDTPLALAAKMGHRDIVRLLLSHGSDVKLSNKDGKTALHWASSWPNPEDPELVRLLLQNGADPNQLDAYEEGWTPLQRAGAQGYVETVRALLAFGAKPNVTDSTGLTALHKTIWHFKTEDGDVPREILDLLVSHGADVSARTTGQSHPFRRATPLHLAAARANEGETVRYLVEHGADTEALDAICETPLANAIAYKNMDTARLLIDMGANVRTPQLQGQWQVIHAAVMYDVGPGEYINLLLDADADIEATNRDGDTPLLLAALKGKADIVEILLDRGANTEAKNNMGKTVLIHAAKYNTDAEDKPADSVAVEVLNLLLDKGANINAVDNSGQTALFLATSFGNSKAEQLLLERGATPLRTDRDGYTYLHHAAHNASVERLRSMLSRGVDVNIKDAMGRAPLMYAVFWENEANAEVLIDKPETDLNNQNCWGMSVLSLAVLRAFPSLVQKMLATGRVNIRARDYLGRSALWYATRYGREDVEKALIEHATKEVVDKLRAEDPPIVPPNPIRVTSPKRYPGRRWCDCCMLSLEVGDAAARRCGACHEDDLDLCGECWGYGARCLGGDGHADRIYLLNPVVTQVSESGTKGR